VRKPLVLSGRTDRPPRRCGRDHPCAGCPDGYSCAPLYGAYGPYGTARYWGAYTFSGWDRWGRATERAKHCDWWSTSRRSFLHAAPAELLRRFGAMGRISTLLPARRRKIGDGLQSYDRKTITW